MTKPDCICNVGHTQGKACPVHGNPAMLEDLNVNPGNGMNLEWLAIRCGVDLYIGDLGAVVEPYGDLDASPYAQACRRGVCTLGVQPDCAYSVVHEMAHILVGFGALESEDIGVELRVRDLQKLLASMLAEPYQSKARRGSSFLVGPGHV